MMMGSLKSPNGGSDPNAGTPAQILGRKIRALRREAGLSLRELGAAVGVSLVQLQRYETGVSPLSTSRLLLISTVLGVRPGSLLGDIEMTAPDDQANRRRQEERELAVLFASLSEPGDRRAILSLARVSAARDELQRLSNPGHAQDSYLSLPEAK
ncbi:helix-turn-helix domain-containing protein [Acidocella sp.]|uniref:helix-turn-helix domain-containing protein n=1 Tax=Acidocella sp. TaxID=50710 RepID=UPI0026048B6E|nr:helix-turn-helix transcriptional regulator [Acidocella sp.]